MKIDKFILKIYKEKQESNIILEALDMEADQTFLEGEDCPLYKRLCHLLTD